MVTMNAYRPFFRCPGCGEVLRAQEQHRCPPSRLGTGLLLALAVAVGAWALFYLTLRGLLR
jgi:hypothetical protein